MINAKKTYSFDDLLLVPQMSEVESRTQVDLSVDLGKGIKLNAPFISANMKSITELKMALAMSKMGGLAILHRFWPIEEQISAFKEANSPSNVGCSVGVKPESKEHVDKLVDTGCKIVCIDVAHGHSKLAGDMTKYIADKYPEVLLISGNVCTAEGASFLYEHGADVIRCGIGNGSNCTTRIEAAAGVPQMTALETIYQNSIDQNDKIAEQARAVAGLSTWDWLSDYNNRKYKIIADGGIRNSGDCTKALCFADMVMLGSVISGADECPGEVQKVNGQMVKMYEGSSTHKTSFIEGVKRTVPLKGPVKYILKQLVEGIQSGCSYQGASNLTELKRKAKFAEISNAGLIESKPHGLL